MLRLIGLFVVLLIAWSSSSVSAQAPAVETELDAPAAYENAPAPQTAEAESEVPSERADNPPRRFGPSSGLGLDTISTSDRLTLEILFGFLSAMSSLVLGGLLIGVISLETEGADDPLFILGAGLTALLVPVLASLAVSFGGSIRGGRGLYSISLAGALIGAAIGFGVFLSVASATDSGLGAFLGVSIGTVGSVAGAILAFELSHWARVEPVVALSPEGGLIGARFVF